MAVWDVFASEPYEFLFIDQGVEGNTISSTVSAMGIFKLRDGMTQLDNLEQYTSDASIHVHPTESFVDTLEGNMVGHGIRVARGSDATQTYRIINQVDGYDFDLQYLDFYRLVLKREDIATWQGTDLPLE
jgi:hypothetical protein